MTQIVIDKKKYVLVPEKEYQALQLKAALKTRSERLLSVSEARAYSKKLIRKWAASKAQKEKPLADDLSKSVSLIIKCTRTDVN